MKNYSSMLGQVLDGNLLTVSQACYSERESNSPSVDEILERQLLAFRLALKAGNSEIPVESLHEAQTKNMFLKGEILFFKGIYFGQFHQPDRATHYFELAQESYAKCHDQEKELLSEYNALMGHSNQGNFIHELEIDLFVKLKNKARSVGIKNIEFLCRRHLAYKYFDMGKLDLAIQILPLDHENTLNLPKSDLDLACIHLADCHYENGDLRTAIDYFDRVSKLCDERVQFPRAFIESKIFRKPIEIAKFKYISSYWKRRFEQTQLENPRSQIKPGVQWDQKNGYLKQKAKLLGKIRPLTLAGQLIKILREAPRTKSYICESLWPGELTCDYLNDRFHQLILRTNRKVKKLIVFDGQFYRLNLDIAD